MSESIDILKQLGVKVPEDLYPDAVHLVADGGKWQIQALFWDEANRGYVLADVDRETGELVNRKSMNGVREDPKKVYGDRAMARLFTRFNSAVPSLSYYHPNTERERS